MTRFVSLGVLLGILVVVGVLFYQVMSSFLLPLFLAALIVVVFEPMYAWIDAKCGQRRHLSALLTTLTVSAIAILPTVVAVGTAASEGLTLRRSFDSSRLQHLITKFRSKVGLEMPFPEQINQIEALLTDARWDAVELRSSVAAEFSAELRQLAAVLHQLDPKLVYFSRSTMQSEIDAAVIAAEELQESLSSADFDELAFVTSRATLSRQVHDFRRDLCGGPARAWAIDLANPSPSRIEELRRSLTQEFSSGVLPVANATTSFVAQLGFGLFIMFVAVFFFFLDGKSMTTSVVRLIPLDVRHQHELLSEFSAISRAVVLATLLSALAQGLLTGLGLWFVGMDSVIFLTIMSIFLALVPFVGAMAVWAPACLWIALIEERMGAAVGLAIYGLVVVSQADNIVKPFMLRGRSNVHPLLALLSILGGVQTLGAIGILVGPMIVVFLQTLLKILHRELLAFEPQSPIESRSSAVVKRRTRPDPVFVLASPSMRRQISGIIRRFVRPQ